MKRVVLLSCVSKKQKKKAKARNLYISTLFKLSLKYAEKLKPDKIFVLSAKYGLISLEKVIDPYEVTLNTMYADEIKEWAKKVTIDLYKVIDPDKDEVIFLAGIKYRKHLTPSLRKFKVPLFGLPIGKQLSYLKSHLKEDL